MKRRGVIDAVTEVADGIREAGLGAYRTSGMEVNNGNADRNRRVRDHTHCGVGGRRG
jgi:hypothetical protein